MIEQVPHSKIEIKSKGILFLIYSFIIFIGYPQVINFKDCFDNFVIQPESFFFSFCFLVHKFILPPISSDQYLACLCISVYSRTFYLTLINLAFIFRTIFPFIDTVTIRLTIFKQSLILMAIVHYKDSEAISFILFPLTIVFCSVRFFS